MKTEENITKLQQLDIWLEELCFPGKLEHYIQELGGSSIPNKETRRTLCFYTDRYKYSITAIDREDDEGYLGCIASCRKTRAGEDWLRGNDLPDGKFSKETWEAILKGIIRYEIVKLSKYLQPKVKLPEVSELPEYQESEGD